MIKVDLVTGFLGSGKTTFIKKYARFLLDRGERIGILENDYGAVNVDMLLLGELRGENCELEMVAGGCDLDCHRRRFKTKLISMAMSGYTRIIIEPSGLFDTDEFFDALREDPLENWYEIGSVFCIVDAGLETDMSSEAEFILASQLASCGQVILSRTGNVSQEVLECTKENLNASLNDLLQSGARVSGVSSQVKLSIFDKEWDEITTEEFDYLSKVGYRRLDYAKKYSMDDLSFGSMCFLESKKTIEEMEQIADILLSEAHDEYGYILRVKGFAYDEAAGIWRQLNATRHEKSITDCESGQEVFIVIGEQMNESAIGKLLREKKLMKK